MDLRFYPKPNGDASERGYSADEIRRGIHYIYADVQCPHCAKEQPVAATGYVGGPCCGCGKLTSGEVR